MQLHGRRRRGLRPRLLLLLLHLLLRLLLRRRRLLRLLHLVALLEWQLCGRKGRHAAGAARRCGAVVLERAGSLPAVRPLALPAPAALCPAAVAGHSACRQPQAWGAMQRGRRRGGHGGQLASPACPGGGRGVAGVKLDCALTEGVAAQGGERGAPRVVLLQLLRARQWGSEGEEVSKG